MTHTLLTGDCLSYLQSMSSGAVDAVVTSCPYNIGIKYASYQDDIPRQDYLQWLKTIMIEIARVMTPDGSFFLNIGSTNVDPWISFDVANLTRDIFSMQNHIVWVKSISIADDTVGHFKPISSKRFLNNNHEMIFHLTLDGKVPVDRLAVGVPFKDKTNIKRRQHGQDKRCRGNVVFMPYETVQSRTQKFNHPAGFPVALPEYCLKLTGKKHGLVVDPFSGCGTTTIAAQRLGWDSIGLDIDAGYTKIAQQRLLDEEILVV